ncbi:hypothetical protein B7P43_G06726 [Cryptotermes secundus]|uniref:Uncharacterized protein n=1 Tax=Cryptotermes secundus TaxID=105785 RepID=A0A2J7PSN1_9NEOP|nr:hypothetical protein B7P43_G06726 [Cryptotermes secundus]
MFGQFIVVYVEGGDVCLTDTFKLNDHVTLYLYGTESKKVWHYLKVNTRKTWSNDPLKCFLILIDCLSNQNHYLYHILWPTQWDIIHWVSTRTSIQRPRKTDGSTVCCYNPAAAH